MMCWGFRPFDSVLRRLGLGDRGLDGFRRGCRDWLGLGDRVKRLIKQFGQILQFVVFAQDDFSRTLAPLHLFQGQFDPIDL